MSEINDQNGNNNNVTINIEKDNKISDSMPNETGGFYLRNFLKIYDPNTEEIAVVTSN